MNGNKKFWRNMKKSSSFWQNMMYEFADMMGINFKKRKNNRKIIIPIVTTIVGTVLVREVSRRLIPKAED